MLNTAEKRYEKELVKHVKKLGGKCLKFNTISEAGNPDRLILLPGGFSCWVELKSDGKNLDKLQQIRFRELFALGQNVWSVNSEDQLSILKGYLQKQVK